MTSPTTSLKSIASLLFVASSILTTSNAATTTTIPVAGNGTEGVSPDMTEAINRAASNASTSTGNETEVTAVMIEAANAFSPTMTPSSGESKTGVSVIITEVASKGTTGVCQGNDWIELYNAGTEAVDLSNGYVLCDDKGVNDPDAFRFKTFAGSSLEPQAYLVLCTKLSSTNIDNAELVKIPDPSYPQFGIGDTDTLSLVKLSDSYLESPSRNSLAYAILSKVGPLPGDENTIDVTYAYDAESGAFYYTSTPTPAAANIISPLKTKQQLEEERRSALAAQNQEGAVFFNFGNDGLPVKDGMDEMLQLHISMEPEDYEWTSDHSFYEVYRPFQSAKVTDLKGNLIQAFDSPGRIRPKGQSSLYMARCLRTGTIPFQVDMDYTDPYQTLFGVQRFYLRTHIADGSYMRDWAYNRMLARFNLPYLRARSVQLIINDKIVGPIYTLVEAPDQEYVFARNFPDHKPDSFALYKITNLGVTCGEYSEEQIRNATARLYETNTPPYAFERGVHRRHVDQLGALQSGQCIDNYYRDVEGYDMEDVVLAWLRHNKNCAKMRLSEGLVDRDLGQSRWDDVLEDFLDRHLDVIKDRCNQGCTNSGLAQDVDVDNFLKTMAFYAVTLNQDSPIGNGNNYYLAQTGDGKGWKLQAYDFNFPFAAGCQEEICDDRLVHWSILRPTCTALEDNLLAGPLLSDPLLRGQYLGHVQDFVETIYTNSSLIEEMENHFFAIRNYAANDIYGYLGIFLDYESSYDAADWHTAGQFPLLPLMRVRGEDVRAQLEAISSGTLGQGAIVGTSDNDAWEVCSDWRFEEPDASNCELGCKYDGCHMPGWTVESYCNEETAVCYHGNYDARCENIPDGQTYDGMKDQLDGRRTFCRYANGVPVAASACPLKGNAIVGLKTFDGSHVTLENSAAPVFCVARGWPILALIVIFLAVS